MSFFKNLNNAFSKFIDEVTSDVPIEHRKGKDFEDLVQDVFFPDEFYSLVEKTHDYSTTSKRRIESVSKPDFTFRDLSNNQTFYIEAKYRTSLTSGKLEWCKPYQLERYKTYNDKPFFVIIGFGGYSYAPDAFFLLPLSKAKYTQFYPSYIEKFEISKRALPSSYIWNL